MAKRKALVLKEEYKGKVVTITDPRLGATEFDTTRVPETEYENYRRVGFAKCFEEVDQEDISAEEKVELKAQAKAEALEEGEEEFENKDDDGEDSGEGLDEDEKEAEALKEQMAAKETIAEKVEAPAAKVEPETKVASKPRGRKAAGK